MILRLVIFALTLYVILFAPCRLTAADRPRQCPMPPQAPAVRASCYCGPSCACPAGVCPSRCPAVIVATQPGPVFATVPTPSFGPLPAGYRWAPTAQGHGIVGPSETWYMEPSPDHTARLNAGYFYTPCPDANNFPRGFWVSPCVKDENCRVIQCNIPPIGQHGEPTAPNAEATARGNDFHPNAHVSGYQRVLTGCANGACPVQQPAPVQYQLQLVSNGRRSWYEYRPVTTSGVVANTSGVVVQSGGCANGTCNLKKR